MTLILALLTFVVFIGIGYLSQFMKDRMIPEPAPEGPVFRHAFSREATTVASESVPGVAILPGSSGDIERVEGYALPDSLFYHQGHAWVALQDSGTAVIGIDDFAGKLLGKPTSIQMPRVGETCRQGATAWSLSRNEKALNMLSPLDGKVVAVNERALDDPGIITKEPYGNGWLVMVQPRELKRNLRNLISGGIARGWMEESASGLRSTFSGELGPVYNDGGLPEDGLADDIDEAVWDELTSRVFLLERNDEVR
jgi:glycine cleavage system H lipoate-binding protein